MSSLVIVESPAKGRTISRFLGKDFTVAASFGHIRDLPEKELGVDTEREFKPHYVIIPRAGKTIARLKQQAEQAKEVLLATDYDREGEAIAWHVTEALGLGNSKSETRNSKPVVKRITFHEITKQAIEEALKHSRDLDLKLIDAQQARRILDRLVGYKLSPFLWEKVFKGLSAGRVQSVAVRLIVDREREIEGFTPQQYWTIVGAFKANGGEFEAQLIEYLGKKLEKLSIITKQQADEIVKNLSVSDLEFRISDFSVAEQLKWSFPPFTTSTLQQDANHRLGFSAKKTMKLAQGLYEAGYITYMRTDSPNLAWVAVNTTRKLIEREFGTEYLPEKPRNYRAKTLGAQEAHEAIRPTYIDRKELEDGKTKWTADHRKLYQLIWQRMVACQMTPASLAVTTVTVKAQSAVAASSAKVATKAESAKADELATFRATGQIITFDGWTKVYQVKFEETKLPALKQGTSVDLKNLTPKEHQTEPLRRYTEASLVKALEEHGIGRPSTYAPTISTIQDRGYVRLQNRQFYPEQVGTIVTDLLKQHFSQIVDISFTATMEGELDEIAEGKKNWVAVIRAFYEPFAKNLAAKYQQVASDTTIADQATNQVCKKCGKPMVVRLGRFGQFLACSGYPECKNTKSIIHGTGMQCPECGKGEVLERRSRRGKVFWGCSRYPECKWSSWEAPKANENLKMKSENPQ